MNFKNSLLCFHLQIYQQDLERQSQLYKELRRCAVNIIVHGLDRHFARDVHHRFICIDKRWNFLHQKLQLDKNEVKSWWMRPKNHWNYIDLPRFSGLILNSCQILILCGRTQNCFYFGRKNYSWCQWLKRCRESYIDGVWMLLKDWKMHGLIPVH